MKRWCASVKSKIKIQGDHPLIFSLNAKGNLNLEAGNDINYYAVYDQQNISTTTYKTSSLFGIKYNKTTNTNSLNTISGQATLLQSQNDILSQSVGSQLL